MPDASGPHNLSVPLEGNQQGGLALVEDGVFGFLTRPGLAYNSHFKCELPKFLQISPVRPNQLDNRLMLDLRPRRNFQRGRDGLAGADCD